MLCNRDNWSRPGVIETQLASPLLDNNMYKEREYRGAQCLLLWGRLRAVGCRRWFLAFFIYFLFIFNVYVQPYGYDRPVLPRSKNDTLTNDPLFIFHFLRRLAALAASLGLSL